MIILFFSIDSLWAGGRNNEALDEIITWSFGSPPPESEAIAHPSATLKGEHTEVFVRFRYETG
jgi:hypothetical protein